MKQIVKEEIKDNIIAVEDHNGNGSMYEASDEEMVKLAAEFRNQLTGSHDFVGGQRHLHGLVGKVWCIGDPESVRMGNSFFEGRLKSGDLVLCIIEKIERTMAPANKLQKQISSDRLKKEVLKRMPLWCRIVLKCAEEVRRETKSKRRKKIQQLQKRKT